ncbi:hypothetical protein [Dyadobacter sp. NIV53]|uniref:hypothetical protein n=1 Tax=Dyadobacter sp. NIV53 TaxID=2861765 RepID=UPI001C87D3DA|nr:hypothetical protein [Dyadobacter sp. NIV53]
MKYTLVNKSFWSKTSRDSIKYLVVIAFLALIISCKNKDNSVVTPELTYAADSLIKVVIPDFESIVNKSVTPFGKLDQFTRDVTQRYTPDSELFKNSSTIRFLYDSEARIIGFIGSNAPSSNAWVYEYKNNLPYRIFRATGEYGTPGIKGYMMNEFVYKSSKTPDFILEYYVKLSGDAWLSSRIQMFHDKEGRLIETRDVNKFAVRERYTYTDGNVTMMEAVDPKTNQVSLLGSYKYDNKQNPIKGMFWYSSSNLDLSANNIIEIMENPHYLSPRQQFENSYDDQGRLILQSRVQTDGWDLGKFKYKN